VLPSLLRYIEKRGQIPEKLTLSLASLLILYKENVLSKDGLIFQDEKYVLEFFKGLWFDYDGSRAATVGVAKKALENVSLWGQDLNKVNGLGEKVADHLTAIITHGMRKALTDTLRIKD
jgi:tagaturonate reductase